MMNRHYGIVYIFGLIPLHSKGRAVLVNGPYDEFVWWESFKLYQSWVQILILCKIFKLKIFKVD